MTAAAATSAERDLVGEVVALVAAVRACPARRGELVAHLREAAACYAQLGRAPTARLRGWVLASFEAVGLPDAALPYALEELESGAEPYLVAAAARALRGGTPSGALAPYLTQAVANLRGGDDLVTFSAFGAWARPGEGRSATGEVLETLRWLGPRAGVARDVLAALRASDGDRLPREDLDALDRCLEALRDASAEDDCCALPGTPGTSEEVIEPGADLAAVRFEDQDGAALGFEAMFAGRPAVVAFFYTRCDNPRKCSLTVTRLARVQRALEAAGLLDHVSTAAVTYDPAYDLPPELRQYGRARGWTFHPRHRLLRAAAGHDVLRRHFRLGVSLLASLVTRHRIECFILDGRGRVRRAFTQLQWDEAAALDAVKALLAAPDGPPAPAEVPPSPPAAAGLRNVAVSGASVAPALIAALLPKCPVCWAAYLSATGIAGVWRIPYAPWLIPVAAALMLVNLGALWVRTRGRGRLGFWLAAAGAVVILVGALWLRARYAAAAGVALTAAGSVLAVLGRRAR